MSIITYYIVLYTVGKNTAASESANDCTKFYGGYSFRRLRILLDSALLKMYVFTLSIRLITSSGITKSIARVRRMSSLSLMFKAMTAD